MLSKPSKFRALASIEHKFAEWKLSTWKIGNNFTLEIETTSSDWWFQRQTYNWARGLSFSANWRNLKGQRERTASYHQILVKSNHKFISLIWDVLGGYLRNRRQ